MSPELIGGALLMGVGALSLIAYVTHRLEQGRVVRTRTLAAARGQLKRCWQVVDNLPNAYLSKGLRKIVARVAASALTTARKIDPNDPELSVQEARARLLSDASDPDRTIKPVLTPEARKQASQGLRDLRRLTIDARRKGLIAAQDCANQQLVIDNLLVRLVVDHCKQNAFNAHAIGHHEEALRYVQQAIDTLILANDTNRHSEEIALLSKEAITIRESIRADHDQRHANSGNSLLMGVQAEAKKSEQALRPVQYD